MSDSTHTYDAKDLGKKHKQVGGSTEGGACLSRHDAGRHPGPEGRLKEHSCNHRWQGYKKAVDNSSQYKWTKPKRDKLGGSGRVKLPARCKSGWVTRTIPSGTEWDVETDPNFLTKCNRPYWHESHHIVPNGEFKGAISEVADGQPMRPYYVKLIRNGLLGESYNLNHKVNMIILPMPAKIAHALSLPRHRISAGVISHKAYSNNVRARLDKIFKPVQDEVKAHRSADYHSCKAYIEALSEDLYGKIVAAGKALGGGALDAMTPEQLGVAQEAL